MNTSPLPPSRLSKGGLVRTLTTTAAIAATGLMTAQGAIIYSGIVDKTVSPGATNGFPQNNNIDFDGTSGANLRLTASKAAQTVYGLGTADGLVVMNPGDTMVLNLALGTTVDSSSHFGFTVSDGLSVAGTLYSSVSPGVNGWTSTLSGGYVGFVFQNEITAQNNYGWAQIQLTASPNTARFVDFAWEDTGAPILVGQTVSVPEPSALLLGAAGLGLFLGRRRRA